MAVAGELAAADTWHHLIWSPPQSHQNRTKAITGEMLSMELRVLHPMVPPITIGR